MGLFDQCAPATKTPQLPALPAPESDNGNLEAHRARTENNMSSFGSFHSLNIDLLFKHAAEDGCGCKFNPVTGGQYVPGLDCLKRQKMLARRALDARNRFEVDGPPDAQPLPLTTSEREEFKNSFL